MKNSMIMGTLLSLLIFWGCLQPENQLTLTVEGLKTTLVGKADTSTLTASQGEAPYRWKVSGELGEILLSAQEGETTTVSLDVKRSYTPGDKYTVTVTDARGYKAEHVYTLVDAEEYKLIIIPRNFDSSENLQYDPDNNVAVITEFIPGERILLEAEEILGLKAIDPKHLVWGTAPPDMRQFSGSGTYSTEDLLFPHRGVVTLNSDNPSAAMGDLVSGNYSVTYDDGADFTGENALTAAIEIKELVPLAFSSLKQINTLVGRKASDVLVVSRGKAPFTWTVEKENDDQTSSSSDDLVLSEAAPGDTSQKQITLKDQGVFRAGDKYSITVTDSDGLVGRYAYTLQDISASQYKLLFDKFRLPDNGPYYAVLGEAKNVSLKFVDPGDENTFISGTIIPDSAWKERGFIQFDSSFIDYPDPTPYQPGTGSLRMVWDTEETGGDTFKLVMEDSGSVLPLSVGTYPINYLDENVPSSPSQLITIQKYQ